MFTFERLILISSIFISSIVISNLSYASNNKQPPPREGRGERPSFTTLDINSDGGISFEEFTSKPLPFGDHQAIFLTIDTNEDGVIDEQEFINHKPPHKKIER